MGIKQLTVAIAGTGARGADTYAACAELYPEKMKIVAAADLRADRLRNAAQKYNIPEENCFSTVEQMLEQDQLADVMLICTQDRQHVKHAIPAMRKGYHILIEKPISPDLEECREIIRVAEETKRTVMVCHVLRFTPFYNKLKQLLDDGVIGEIVSIQHIENVGYWHQAHSYVRGNWRRSDETSPMILAKCCHDLDLLLWLTGKHCLRVNSFGGTYLFRKEKAPDGAASRCLDGCTCQADCPYDCERQYITGKTGFDSGRTGWPVDVVAMNPTREKLYEALKTGPYGRCVYYCDNDAVDHQIVNMELEDGVTCQMTMCAFNEGGRRTKLMGTLGEIECDLEKNTIYVHRFCKEEYTFDVTTLLDKEGMRGHAGGDHRMVEEFLDIVSGRIVPTVRTTTLADSVESHFIALAAEISRNEQGRTVSISEVSKQTRIVKD